MDNGGYEENYLNEEEFNENIQDELNTNIRNNGDFYDQGDKDNQ